MDKIKKKFKFVDLFSGIGGFHIAAKENGGKCVFASDIDFEASKTYEVNFGLEPHGDITKIIADDIPKHNLLCAGFPCQPFSIIGNRKGFDDMRGTLFFEIIRILENKKPEMFILENVKQLSTHNKKQTIQRILDSLEELGYKTHWNVLNALDYGLPQRRERTLIVGFLDHSVVFKWPKKVVKYKHLDKILEKNVDRRHYASPMIRKKRKNAHSTDLKLSIWHENKSGNVASHPYSCAIRANASYNYLLVNGERRLTPRELFRLQGFPETYKIICSDLYAKKQAGNAVPINMIRAVIKEMMNAKTTVKRFK